MKVDLQHQELTEQIIGAAFEVHNTLGYGFLEKVYQRAMQVELRARGLEVKIEREIRVTYKGVEVGFSTRPTSSSTAVWSSN